MTLRPLSLTAALALLLPLAAPAQAQSCAPRDSMVKRLLDGYGENFAGGGLQNAEAVFEVWTSPDAGTWTILMTRADGTSCIMAAGTNWRPQLDRHIVRGTPS
ncbi:hypothetical protein [Jannaschia sp. M317]|uniref:hypothetical protein n=1 Tax=Jannaschia sp. M317 TaxID=2867011 RepID=UPI0021A6AE19|nr:hypothetical protein [Jannaschia sp. M317]UWQ18526.1 hypothetical protein K3551_04300 [Jannaschia sp. M317]